MKIIVDAMSGDKAPAEIVRGAAAAHRDFDTKLVLVGRAEEVTRLLEAEGGAADIEVADAADVIDMSDDPSTAVRRKKDSSMAVALRMLAEGEGDAVVSAGNTGALLTGATLVVKRIRGIRRAALAPIIPNGGAGVMLIDAGANVECTTEYLLQFACMGSYYVRRVLGIDTPKVALLNVGTEDVKGTQLQKEAFALLTGAAGEDKICFVGNVEGSDVFSGKADVLVCDGFAGNVLLKTLEGTAKFLMSQLKSMFMSGTKTKLAGALVRGEMDMLKRMLDSSEVGGTPLLGISKPVIKAHGSSDARAIRNAIHQAAELVKSGVIADIELNIDQMKI